MDSSDSLSNSQITNGFAIPHNVNDNDSIRVESQETQAGSTTNTQLDDEMGQDTNEEEQDEEDEGDQEEEEEEEEDKPSSSSSPPPANLTDENSSSSNSNSTPLPSSSTEDMLEQ